MDLALVGGGQPCTLTSVVTALHFRRMPEPTVEAQTHRESSDLVARAVAGDRGAGAQLVAELSPVIQRVVTQALLSTGALAAGDGRQMVKDLVQQVFVALFERDARTLRSWDPMRGRSLRSFAGMLAEREVWSLLRSRARSPLQEMPSGNSGDLVPEIAPREIGPEDLALRRQLVLALVKRVGERLGERGLLLLRLLVMEERSAEEVTLITGMTEGAVYAWHTRFRRLVKELAEELGLQGAAAAASEKVSDS